MNDQPEASARVDAAFAAQLRESMEANARMKNRIMALREIALNTVVASADRDIVLAIDNVLADRDP